MSNDSAEEIVLKMNEAITSLTGIKFAHEMLVDIYGAIIPGVLFLSGLLFSVGIPLCLLLSVNGLVISIDGSGWILLIAFLLFLILSCTIGLVFYRKDIKVPDKLDVAREQRKKLKSLKKILRLCPDGDIDIEEKIVELILSEINPLIHGLDSIINKCVDDTKDHKTESTTEFTIESSIIERRKEYNRRLYNSCNDCINSLARSITDSSTQWDDFENSTLPWCLINVMFPEINIEYTKYAEDEEVGISDLPISAIELYTAFIKNTHSLRNIILRKGGSLRTYQFAVCYLILHLQNESACATEARCDFPYLNYYKYLLKRQILELLKYVDWQRTEIRTKNKINQYKVEIQIHNPNVYSIITKNESHIRMASSTWYASRLIRNISFCVLLILLFVTAVWFYNIYSIERNCEVLNWIIELFAKNQAKPSLINVILAFLAPATMFVGFWYIKQQIVKFIHYQRLREIYFTLKAYHECKSV